VGTRLVTSLGHQGGRVLWEGTKFFKLCPIILNYVLHISPGGAGNFVWGGFASPGYGPGGNAVPTPNIKEDWFVYENFRTGSSCFTLVLRCYARDSLSFMLLQALHVQIEMKNLNLQVTLRVKKVWERRSHPTTPLLTGLMLTSSHL